MYQDYGPVIKVLDSRSQGRGFDPRTGLCVYVIEQDTIFHIVPVHTAENEYQQKLGVDLAIDRRPIQGGYCTLS